MSAIFGILRKDDSPARLETLKVMRDTLASFGEYEGGNLWLDGGASIGHLLTHNTPESFYEKQPFQDPNSRWVITAAARLDNRTELCNTLEVPSQARPQMSDDQLILRAALKWGAAECARYLLGAFAFAIYNLDEQRLTLVRDQIGFQQLVYYDSPHYFAFASDVRAFLALPGFAGDFDGQALLARDLRVYSYLVEHTIYKGVLKLAPGSTVTLKPGARIQKHTYWRVEARPLLQYKHINQYAEHLRELLQQSVSARLRSAFPISAHYSNGMDSVAIAVLAARQLKQCSQRLSGGFMWIVPQCPWEREEELMQIELARKGMDREGIPSMFVEVDPDGYFQLLQAGEALQVPLPIRIGHLMIMDQAALHNSRTVLSGLGGNELITFFGFGYLASLLLRLRWLKLARETRWKAHNYETSLRATFRKEILPAITPEFFKSWRNAGDSPYLHDLLALYKLDLEDIYTDERQMLNEHYRVDRFFPNVRTSQLRFLSRGFINHRIENSANYAARRAIEHRYPLLDKRMVEFALALPDEMYFQKGWRRFLFRYATAAILPEEIRWRIKKSHPQRNRYFRRIKRESIRRYFELQQDGLSSRDADFNLDYRLNRILAGVLDLQGRKKLAISNNF